MNKSTFLVLVLSIYNISVHASLSENFTIKNDDFHIPIAPREAQRGFINLPIQFL